MRFDPRRRHVAGYATCVGETTCVVLPRVELISSSNVGVVVILILFLPMIDRRSYSIVMVLNGSSLIRIGRHECCCLTFTYFSIQNEID
jgi:hypothetical protein